MKKQEFKAVKRELTPAQRARREAGVKAAESDRAAIVARGREALRSLPAHDVLQQAFARLREERVRQGLTLAQVEQRSGIGAPALSRLETSAASNPTIDTICRVAMALGKRVKIELEDAK